MITWSHVIEQYITLMSAPDRSSLAIIYSSKSTSLARVILVVCIWNILRLVFSSGSGNSILRSIRPRKTLYNAHHYIIRIPGLMRAGSSVSILLVAITTLTSPRESNPSNWFNNSSKVRCISLSPPEWLSYLWQQWSRCAITSLNQTSLSL